MSFFKSLLISFLILSILFSTANSFADESNCPPKAFKNETEVNISLTGGNSQVHTYSFRQKNKQCWNTHTLELEARYYQLDTNKKDVNQAKNWLVSVRFEEDLYEKISGYIGQLVESNIFSGYLQRYSSDFGGQYSFYNRDDYTWYIQTGYRYTIENQTTGNSHAIHFFRIFTELEKDLSELWMGTVNLEFLPNIYQSNDFRANLEMNLLAKISQIFSFKIGYQIKYMNQPLPGAIYRSETITTTGLVINI